MRTGHALENRCARAVTRKFEGKCGTCKTAADDYGIHRRAVDGRFVKPRLSVFQDFARKARAVWPKVLRPRA